MLSRSIAIPPKLRQWGAYAVILLAPGSLVVLPALWLLRQVMVAVRQESHWRQAACDPTRRGPAYPGHQGILRRIVRRLTLDVGACCKSLAKG
jgi:hypothetical protein